MEWITPIIDFPIGIIPDPTNNVVVQGELDGMKRTKLKNKLSCSVKGKNKGEERLGWNYLLISYQSYLLL